MDRARAQLLSSILVVGALLSIGATDVTGDDSYLLVINANNKYSGNGEEMRQEIRRLYLRHKSNWPDEETSSPLGRPVHTDAHQAFLTFVLGMTQTELNDHWSRLKQISGETPPREVERPRTLLRQIARDKGAFSVIAESETRKLPARVRVLFTFPQE